MAHKMLKGYSFLFYFLMFIVSFCLGLIFAGIIGAGKHQGLAGGAIVLGYGVVGAFIGLLLALFIAYRANRKALVWSNIVLAVAILCFWCYNHHKYKVNQKARELEKEKIKKPKSTTPTKPVDYGVTAKTTAMLFKQDDQKESLGLGMFIPNLADKSALYFYGNPNLKKSRLEHTPTDSITFKKSEYGGHGISTAPPWLMPEHLKLDYDMFYFKVKSVTQDFVEVYVNTVTRRTAFVDKYQGKVAYWPEFLLGVHSVEFLKPEAQFIYIKALDHAGKVSVPHSFMKPIRISANWMYVELINDSFETVGKGWIKWVKDGELLIRYNLLS